MVAEHNFLSLLSDIYHKQIRRVSRTIQRLKRKEESEAAFNNSALRKAPSKTLIQPALSLGKQSHWMIFSIELGTDLQKDIECKYQVHALFGALLKLRLLLKETDEYSHSYLALRER